MQQQIYLNSQSIEYIDVGIGEIIVLLHGFGEDNTIFQYQIDFLKDKYRLIVPNLPGTGNSTILQQKDISITDYAMAIYNFLQKLINIGNNKVVMLGHSMGGYIALAYAKLYSSTLNKLGLLHSTAYADSEEKKQNRLRGMAMMYEYGAEAFLKNTTPNLFSSYYKKYNYAVVESLIKNGKNFSVEALAQYYKAMMNRENNAQILSNATMPILFIMGVEDLAAPLTDLLQQCHLPQFSHIKVLPNVAHMGMLEATTEFNSTIAAFLSY